MASPYNYEQLKARQRAVGPTGSFSDVGGEPDYNAPALEDSAAPDTTSVAPPAAPAPAAPVVAPQAPAKSGSMFEHRLAEYRDKVYWPEYTKYVAKQIKGLYPAIPEDADPTEVISRYKQAFAPEMSDEDFFSKLDQTHAKNFEPSVKEPTPNLIETAQLAATPQNAVEMAKGAGQFIGASGGAKILERNLSRNLPSWVRAGWGNASALTSLGRAGGQVALAVPTAIKLAGAQMAGNELERTAAEMPVPDIASLRARGYSEAQIHNIVNGYTQVQQDLASEQQKMGQEGVSASTEGISNSLLFGMGSQKLDNLVEKAAGKGVTTTGANAAARAVAAQTVGHAATGAAFGGTYGAVHGASQRMAEAKAAGLGANDIFSAAVHGAGEEAPISATIGGILGGTIGAPLAIVSTGAAAARDASVLRKAVAQNKIEDALRINLQKFADGFKANELPERFPEDLKAAPDDASLAQNIVSGVWGPEVAQSEDGMRAASKIYERIAAWRNTRDKLNNMIEPTAEVPLTPTLPFPGFESTAQTAIPRGEGGLAPQPGTIGEYTPSPQTPPPPVAQEYLPGGMPGSAPIPRVPTGVEQLDLLAPQQTTFLGPPAGPAPPSPSPQFKPSGKSLKIERFPRKSK